MGNLAAISRIPGARAKLLAAAAFAVVAGLLCLGQAVGLAKAIVNIWAGAPLEEQAAWVALFCACLVLRSVTTSCEGAIVDRFAQRAAADLRMGLLDAAWQMGPAYVRAHGSGAVAADVLQGVDSVEELLRIIIPKTANVVLVPLVLLTALFGLDWVSGIIALACYPFIIIFMRLIGMSAGDEARKRYAEFERMSASFTDIAGGLGTLKAFGASARFADKVFAASERFRQLTMRTLRIAMLSSTVLDLFATLALAGVAIMLGFRLVDGSMQFFPALTVLMLVPEYFKPIREYADDYHATLEGEAALAAAQAMLAETESMSAEDEGGEAALRALGAAPGQPGHLGLMGASGSGKTTLLNRIAGFSGARDDAWAARIAYIPQAPYLLHASLRENVSLYAPEAASEEVLAALSAVGLRALAESLPEGLDTLIGPGGRELSGGQAQRVAFARALLDPKRDIWLLDEPTAHLDARTETELISCVTPLMRDKTVVMAVHGKAWLPHLDRVVELTSSGPTGEAA